MKKYTFKRFAAETFSYVLSYFDGEWSWDIPEEVERDSNDVFDTIFGDAVICYLERNRRKKAILKIENFPDLDTYEEIRELVDEAMLDACEGDCFLMDIIRVFAFFTNLARKFELLSEDDLIETVLDVFDELYNRLLKKPLNVVGGYFALFRFANQYLEYRKIGSAAMLTGGHAVEKEWNNSDVEMGSDDSLAMDLNMNNSETEEFSEMMQEPTSTIVRPECGTPAKSDSDVRAKIQRALKNEFSSPHSEHCPSEFCRTPGPSVDTSTSKFKFGSVSKKLNFPDSK